jgi:GH43 family beta-xylosidase
MRWGPFSEPKPVPGQDPWIVPFEGSFLLVQAAANNREIVIRRFTRLADMGHADEKVIWAPGRRGDHGRQIWAPELHLIDGDWYVYFTASDGHNRNHRSYVIQADHPLGPYRELGKVFDERHDTWSIDLTVFEHAGGRYAVWSGWDGPDDGFPQNLYLAPMANPWTISGERVLISRPEYDWEMSVAAVNEGPELLRSPDGGRLFIVYSADASWSTAYKLGCLEWAGGQVTDPSAWRKLPQPIFAGGGHACFVEADGVRYVAYHHKSTTEPGWADREIKVERLGWDAAGHPVVGAVDAARPRLHMVKDSADDSDAA